MGRQKAAVLPEPVTAEPQTSFPAKTTGMTAVCGVGVGGVGCGWLVRAVGRGAWHRDEVSTRETPCAFYVYISGAYLDGGGRDVAHGLHRPQQGPGEVQLRRRAKRVCVMVVVVADGSVRYTHSYIKPWHRPPISRTHYPNLPPTWLNNTAWPGTAGWTLSSSPSSVKNSFALGSWSVSWGGSWSPLVCWSCFLARSRSALAASFCACRSLRLSSCVVGWGCGGLWWVVGGVSGGQRERDTRS